MSDLSVGGGSSYPVTNAFNLPVNNLDTQHTVFNHINFTGNVSEQINLVLDHIASHLGVADVQFKSKNGQQEEMQKAMFLTGLVSARSLQNKMDINYFQRTDIDRNNRLTDAENQLKHHLALTQQLEGVKYNIAQQLQLSVDNTVDSGFIARLPDGRR